MSSIIQRRVINILPQLPIQVDSVDEIENEEEPESQSEDLNSSPDSRNRPQLLIVR